MSETSMKILETFTRALQGMTEAEKEQFLCFSEGLAAAVKAQSTATKIVHEQQAQS